MVTQSTSNHFLLKLMKEKRNMKKMKEAATPTKI